MSNIECPECEFSTDTLDLMKTHIREHDFHVAYLCSFPGCNKLYFDDIDLCEHIRDSHIPDNDIENLCCFPGCNFNLDHYNEDEDYTIFDHYGDKHCTNITRTDI